MSEQQARKSHKKWWMLSIVAALSLYLLSYGPMMALYTLGRFSPPHSDWLLAVYKPIDWLHGHTFMHEPLDFYVAWSQRLLW